VVRDDKTGKKKSAEEEWKANILLTLLNV
jgi:hypothetical protein